MYNHETNYPNNAPYVKLQLSTKSPQLVTLEQASM